MATANPPRYAEKGEKSAVMSPAPAVAARNTSAAVGRREHAGVDENARSEHDSRGEAPEHMLLGGEAIRNPQGIKASA
jgi:hypothetical protein